MHIQLGDLPPPTQVTKTTTRITLQGINISPPKNGIFWVDDCPAFPFGPWRVWFHFYSRESQPVAEGAMASTWILCHRSSEATPEVVQFLCLEKRSFFVSVRYAVVGFIGAGKGEGGQPLNDSRLQDTPQVCAVHHWGGYSWGGPLL